MTQDVLSRIYEPFFTTKNLGKGTGLGLFTAYAIVKQSKGCIHAESEPGKGSKFTVVFPRIVAPSAAPAPSRMAAVRGGSETILLAEDEQPIRELFSMYLRKLGYRVLTAENGAHAMQTATAHSRPIDLLIPMWQCPTWADWN